jgi:hypothetical protein
MKVARETSLVQYVQNWFLKALLGIRGHKKIAQPVGMLLELFRAILCFIPFL